MAANNTPISATRALDSALGRTLGSMLLYSHLQHSEEGQAQPEASDPDWWEDQKGQAFARLTHAQSVIPRLHSELRPPIREDGEAVENSARTLVLRLIKEWIPTLRPGPVDVSRVDRLQKLHDQLEDLRSVLNPTAQQLEEKAGRPHHAEDFTWVWWYGTRYDFNDSQARIVGALWENWTNAGTGIHQLDLGKLIGTTTPSFRLKDTFKLKPRGMHPAWGTMIQTTGKGKFGLVPPLGPRESPT